MFDCIEPIGLIDWTSNTKRQILKVISEKLGWTSANINTLTLIELGGLVSGLESTDSDDFGFGLAGFGAQDNSVGFDVNAFDLSFPASLDVLSILGTKIKDEQVVSF